MGNATAARNTMKMGDDVIPNLKGYPMTAAKTVYPGTMVGLDASGNALSAGDASAVKCVGLFRGTFTADNSGGAAGAVTLNPVRSGVFWMANSSAGDAITAAAIGTVCYVVDDQTVALTDNQGARIAAGTIMDVDSTLGVAVLLTPIAALTGATAAADQAPPSVVTFHLDLAQLATGTVASFKPKFAGRIKSTSFSVDVPATTAAKAATLTPKIAGTATTGGAIALTSANCTPVGNEIDGTAITAANTFTAGQTITIAASAVTAFVEGSGTLVLELA